MTGDIGGSLCGPTISFQSMGPTISSVSLHQVAMLAKRSGFQDSFSIHLFTSSLRIRVLGLEGNFPIYNQGVTDI